MAIGAVCIVLGQCMAGIVTSFGPFLVCQGVIFGAGELINPQECT